MSKRQGWGFFIADEPLSMRLSGKLPTIDLAGTNFTIDVRLRELRKTDSPWNSISFDQMNIGENGDSFELLFDTDKHTIYIPDNKKSALPENIVLLEIPKEKTLDPVAVAWEYGIDLTDLLIDFPFQMKSAARIKSTLEFTRQKSRESINDDQNYRAIKRGR